MTSTPTGLVDNVVIETKGLQDRNIYIIAGKKVENKGKLILETVLTRKSECGTTLPPEYCSLGRTVIPTR